MSQVLIPSRLQHPFIMSVEAVFLNDVHACVWMQYGINSRGWLR